MKTDHMTCWNILEGIILEVKADHWYIDLIVYLIAILKRFGF